MSSTKLRINKNKKDKLCLIDYNKYKCNTNINFGTCNKYISFIEFLYKLALCVSIFLSNSRL